MSDLADRIRAALEVGGTGERDALLMREAADRLEQLEDHNEGTVGPRPETATGGPVSSPQGNVWAWFALLDAGTLRTVVSELLDHIHGNEHWEAPWRASVPPSKGDHIMAEATQDAAKQEQALTAMLQGRPDDAKALLRSMTYAERYLLGVACERLHQLTSDYRGTKA